jgi:septal ring factor EnvC (AmiA/AmiB activator)
MKKITFAFILSIVLLNGQHNIVFAQQNNAQERLQAIQEELKEVKPKETELALEQSKIKRSAKELQNRLIESASHVQESEKELQVIEEKLMPLLEEEEKVLKEFNKEKRQLTQSLSAMNRLSLAPKTPFGTEEDPTKTLYATILLRNLTDELAFSAKKIKESLDKLSETRQVLEDRRSEISLQQAELVKQHDELDKLVKERENNLKLNQEELEKTRGKIANLSNEAKNIQTLLTKLQLEEQKRIREERQRLLALEQQKKQELIIVNNEKETAPEREEAEQKIVAIDKEKDEIKLSQSKTLLTSNEITSYQGKMLKPVSGTVTGHFGEKKDAVTKSGITFSSRTGAVVTAPIQGKIMFASRFRDYGNMVIIQPSNDYHIVLYGVDALNVKMGQWVNMGEPIGKLKNTGTNADLHLEIRKKGVAVNPENWLQS